jgi:hypothetical protein
MLRHKTATGTLNTYAHLWPEDNALVCRAVDGELNPIVGIERTDPTADISRTSGSHKADGQSWLERIDPAWPWLITLFAVGLLMAAGDAQ